MTTPAHDSTPAPPPGCPAHAAQQAVPLSGPRFHTDPAQLYRDIRREHGPVVPTLLPGDIPAWLVIGYREMYHVTSEPHLFPRDPGLWNQWDAIPNDWPLRPMVGNRQPSIYYTVGAEHQRHVAMVQSALDGVSQLELDRQCEELADQLIDGFCQRGEADIIADYAKPLPILVLSRLLGLPDADAPAMTQAINALADGGLDALEGFQYFADRLARLVQEKRAAPGADVTSRMLAYPEPFTDEEYKHDLQALLAAGHLPTADWIGNSVRLMLTDDRFAASFSGGRHSVAEAMNEVLWEDTPTQILAGRWASRDTTLGGCRIAAGDMLLLGLAGANADPEVNVSASTPDGFRNGNNAHFSFSHGEFGCPFQAQEMAESIARIGTEVLLDRLPDVDLAVPAQTLARRPSAFLRGMTVLPVNFSPNPPVGGR